MCACETNQVGVPHERPRLGAEVETELQFGDAPVGLHRRARVALDRQVFVGERFDGKIVYHSG